MSGREALPPAGLAFAGGPLGRFASARARSWSATVSPLLAATVGTMALSVVERAHCIQHGWNGSDQFWHGCFSNLPAAYQLGNLGDGLSAYVGDAGARSDDPVLTGAVMALLGGMVPDGDFLDQTRWYVALWAVVATVCAIATVWFTAASRPRHAAVAGSVALSPVLLLTGLLSGDLLAVALTSAGVWAWSRRRPALAGALLGLGVAARTYPVLVLLALVLLGLRTGRWGAVRRTLAAAAGAVAVVLLPFLVGHPGAIGRSYEVWWDSTAGLGSVWMLPQLLGLEPWPSGLVTLVSVAATVLALLAGVVFALGTTRRPTLAEVGLVLVALTLVVGKSVPVQSSVWLVPLVALCGLRWRDQLVWAGAEALHFVMVWLYFGGLSRPERGLPAGWYAFFLVLRVAAVVYLVVRVWRTAAERPQAPDPVPSDPESVMDRGGQDRPEAPDPDGDAVVDELAGDFTDAPDQLLVRLA